MASRTVNTMVEGLKGIQQQIGELKTYPDADLEWLINLETQVIQKIREPYDMMAGQMDAGGAPADPMAGGGMGDPSFPPMPDMGGGGVPPSMMGGLNGGGAPAGVNPVSSNPDELRRLLS